VLSKRLEEIRDKFQKGNVKIHITGFAKVVGDLIEGLPASRVSSGRLRHHARAALLHLALPAQHRRAAISSLVAVVCSWGFSISGYGSTPTPCSSPSHVALVSHGIQMGNAMSHEMLTTDDKLLAAQRASGRCCRRPGGAADLMIGSAHCS